jgi:uncharacterized membrane protein
MKESLEAMKEGKHWVDKAISLVLRAGVIIAAALVSLGAAPYLVRHPIPPVDYRVFHGEPLELRSMSGVLREALAFHGSGFIQLGLLVLIATPIARVVLSVFVFLYERDWPYVFITLVVLGILLYSLLAGYAG